jgi:hypothetical protein
MRVTFFPLLSPDVASAKVPTLMVSGSGSGEASGDERTIRGMLTRRIWVEIQVDTRVMLKQDGGRFAMSAVRERETSFDGSVTTVHILARLAPACTTSLWRADPRLRDSPAHRRKEVSAMWDELGWRVCQRGG